MKSDDYRIGYEVTGCVLYGQGVEFFVDRETIKNMYNHVYDTTSLDVELRKIDLQTMADR